MYPKDHIIVCTKTYFHPSNNHWVELPGTVNLQHLFQNHKCQHRDGNTGSDEDSTCEIFMKIFWQHNQDCQSKFYGNPSSHCLVRTKVADRLINTTSKLLPTFLLVMQHSWFIMIQCNIPYFFNDLRATFSNRQLGWVNGGGSIRMTITETERLYRENGARLGLSGRVEVIVVGSDFWHMQWNILVPGLQLSCLLLQPGRHSGWCQVKQSVCLSKASTGLEATLTEPAVHQPVKSLSVTEEKVSAGGVVHFDKKKTANLSQWDEIWNGSH